MKRAILNDELLQKLADAGLKDWKNITDWKKNHNQSYRKFLKLGQHHEIAESIGLSVIIQNNSQKKQEIKHFYNQNKKLPSKGINQYQDTLAKRLGQYCSVSGSLYCKTTHEWAKSVGYGTRVSVKTQNNINAIKLFYQKYKKLPNRYSSLPEEKQLGTMLSKYCQSEREDVLDLKTWAISVGYGKKTPQENQQEVFNFFKDNQRLPMRSSKCSFEKTLANRLKNYCMQTSSMYDPKIDKWARSKGYGSVVKRIKV